MILLVLLNTISFSQTVFSASGGNFSNSTTLIDNTIGEPITSTLQNAYIKLTQGFHQSNYNIISDIKPKKLDVSINIFPNLTAGTLQIQIARQNTFSLNLKFYDINWCFVWNGMIGKGFEVQNIDMSKLASGTYVLWLIYETGGYINSYKVECCKS